jgi:hypothetical protein
MCLCGLLLNVEIENDWPYPSQAQRVIFCGKKCRIFCTFFRADRHGSARARSHLIEHTAMLSAINVVLGVRLRNSDANIQLL